MIKKKNSSIFIPIFIHTYQINACEMVIILKLL